MTSVKSNLEILAHEESPLGLLCLRRRRLLSDPDTVVTEITLNHEFLMSSLHTESERRLAASALRLHGGPGLNVLVGGLGLGYTAREVLRSPRVASLDVVEYLPQVVDWLRQELFPTASELNSDRRCTVSVGDIYARLQDPPAERFDLILIDVDHSPEEMLSPSSGGFYTDAGLNAAGAHLAPGGWLGVWSYADHPRFTEALRRTFRAVRVEQATFLNRLSGENETNWLFFAGDPHPENS
ncbi:MAG: spermidine synthase [Planctomycetes bacterium]|nr:spermidine synthase [Planctomycetota bacterium]